MKRPLGLTVLSLLFAVGGLSGLAQLNGREVAPVARALMLVLAFLSLGLSYGLFKGKDWAFRCYVAWAVTALSWIVTRELAAEDPSWLPAIIVAVFGSAVYAAVGYYLHQALARWQAST